MIFCVFIQCLFIVSNQFIVKYYFISTLVIQVVKNDREREHKAEAHEMKLLILFMYVEKML